MFPPFKIILIRIISNELEKDQQRPKLITVKSIDHLLVNSEARQEQFILILQIGFLNVYYQISVSDAFALALGFVL